MLSPSDSALLTATEHQEVFAKLACPGDQNQSGELEVKGQAALALALARGVPDPNALLDTHGQPRPMLHAVLQALHAQRAWRHATDRHPDIPRLEVDLAPGAPWPEAIATLDARERLALWLLRAGAQPWVQDVDGRDALDWALAAQSRTLVATLLAHPDCPPLDDIKARTCAAPGRDVPWIHALAYANGRALIDDLVAAGFDPAQLDRTGWPPEAWVNNEATLQALLARRPFDSPAQLRVDLEKAWTRRESLKLVEYSFKREALVKALSTQVGLPPEDALQVRLFNLTHTSLAANPAKPAYHYRGVRLTRTGKDTEEVRALMGEQFHWRHVQEKGRARGRWSLLAAIIWGQALGVREQRDRAQTLAELTQVLGQQSLADRKAWLDEAIRPGLTNRGLACWAFGGTMTAIDQAWMAEGLDEPAARRLRLTATVEATVAMASRSMADTTQMLLGDRCRQALEREQAFGQPEPWAFPLFQALIGAQVFTPTLAGYGLLARALEARLASPAASAAPDAPQVLGLAVALLGQPASLMARNAAGHIVDPHTNSEFNRTRQALWASIQRTLAAHPQLVEGLSGESPPIPAPAQGRALPEGLPTPEQWAAFVRQCRLDASMPASAPSARTRPGRM